MVALISTLYAQSPDSASRFEVATIRLNADCTKAAEEQVSPGRVAIRCVTVRQLIRVAYGNPGTPGRRPEVLGGPQWIDSDRYDIQATAAGNPGLDQMYGPMTKALLEDRFRLQLHDEVRDLPVYRLTIANEKVKLKANETCAPIDLRTVLQAPPPSNYCGRNSLTRGPAATLFEGNGVTVAEFIERGLGMLDRPVIDMTGFIGRFDLRLEFSPTDSTVAGDDAPSIFTAVQEQLGLRLSAGVGPVKVHVIDHVERPSQN